MADGEDRIISILEKQASDRGRIDRIETDINRIENTRRELLAKNEKAMEAHENKIDNFEIQLTKITDEIKIYKGFVIAIVAIVSYIVTNIENIKGLLK